MDEEQAGADVTVNAEGPADAAAAPPKRRRLRRVLLRSLIALAVLAALCGIGGTYYFDSVALPTDLTLAQATTIYYADGTTVMSRIGANRTLVAIGQIPVDVQHAVVAAEDPSFYSNEGVDYRDMVGAAWNRVFGDGTEGAATISQQYARIWGDLQGETASRKARESVIALKLNEQYSKDQILEMYLNTVYFGRGAYGIEAAAQGYFGKPATDLTLAEGLVLAGVLDKPGGEGKGSPFDPRVDESRAHERFDQIKGRLLDLEFVTADQARQLAYPANVLTLAEGRSRSLSAAGLDKAEGLIVHHVLGEVAALTDPRTGKLLYADTDLDGKQQFDRVRNGGLKIVTTIDPVVQRAAVREASRNMESNLAGQPDNLQAALVAVEPGTGAVKAYYGGYQGTGFDYAGYYADPVLGDGQDSCCGGHPAGASFNVYALAAGLIAGYSTDSRWNGESPQAFPNSGRAGANPVRNIGGPAAPPCASRSAKWCTLEESAALSLSTPFFALAEAVGPDRVIDTARAAGISSLWATVDGKAEKVDLTKADGRSLYPRRFGTEVAIGQYPVTVLDQAAGMATFAAGGQAARTHFLKEVWTAGKKTYAEVVNPVRIPGFTPQMAADLNAALQATPQRYNLRLSDNRQTAGIAGTWQFGATTDPAHAWMAGYTASDDRSRGLAVAVWVGNKAEERKLVDKQGQPVTGPTLPATIWRDFLDTALTETKAPVATFAPKAGVGDKKVGNGIQP
ncbi:penicillin-binding protein [Dactylosporangium vinaceum]|uniref:Transglycosylase domain-containing protein n=1 Tax=Dactylosporangium vinaceum TaxID=53362 RepID=A0ABV5MCT7_9ACTN|nr:transglycosylase domain-containing protein [Dactylosporangium vinaceum]UAC00733.1 penicillin-binding protein [Dactylosporangium vinaceum]